MSGQLSDRHKHRRQSRPASRRAPVNLISDREFTLINFPDPNSLLQTASTDFREFLKSISLNDSGPIPLLIAHSKPPPTLFSSQEIGQINETVIAAGKFYLPVGGFSLGHGRIGIPIPVKVGGKGLIIRPAQEIRIKSVDAVSG